MLAEAVESAVWVTVPPQQPLVAGGLNASAGSPMKPPVWVSVLLRSLLKVTGGEVCVCDLTAAFDLTQPTISHHLKVLREAGLVDSQRRGTWVYYWPRPENLKRLSVLLDTPALAPV